MLAWGGDDGHLGKLPVGINIFKDMYKKNNEEFYTDLIKER